MSLRVNGVEVFGNDAALNKQAITNQRDGAAAELTSADEMLVYDSESDTLMRISVDEFQEGTTIKYDKANGNVAYGLDAIGGNVSGSGIVAIGPSALQANETGTNTICVGAGAARFITKSDDNTILGSGAAENLTDTSARNAIVGRLAAGNNPASGITSDTVAIGFAAGFNISESTNNTFVGSRSALNQQVGTGNVAVGYLALASANISINNVVIGERAAVVASSDAELVRDNVILGNQSLGSVSQCRNNVSIGAGAAADLDGVAENNVIVGQVAGLGLDNSTNNTFIGYRSGRGIAPLGPDFTGNNNIFIGADSGGGISGYDSENIIIGYDHNGFVTNQSFSVGIGQTYFIRATTIGDPITQEDTVRVEVEALVANRDVVVSRNLFIDGQVSGDSLFEDSITSLGVIETSQRSTTTRDAGNGFTYNPTRIHTFDGFLQDFSGIDNSAPLSFFGLSMANGIAKCKITMLIFEVGQQFATVDEREFYWNGSLIVKEGNLGAISDTIQAPATTPLPIWESAADGFSVSVIGRDNVPRDAQVRFTLDVWRYSG